MTAKDYILDASPTYWSAPEDERKRVCGGCGPGKAGDYIVPDTVYFLSIKLACAIHDWDFYEGTSRTDWKLANKRFRDNMLTIIEHESSWRILVWLRSYRAMTYYRAVSTEAGWISFRSKPKRHRRQPGDV